MLYPLTLVVKMLPQLELEPPQRGRSRQPKQDGDVKPKRQTRKPKSPLPMEPTPTSEMHEVAGTSPAPEVLEEPVPSPDVEEQSLPPAVESKPKKTHTKRTKVEEPPVEEPPVEELPVEEPPVEEPPADEVY